MSAAVQTVQVVEAVEPVEPTSTSTSTSTTTTQTPIARKRRRRTAASGAADDCFACQKRHIRCDRRRPYCMFNAAVMVSKPFAHQSQAPNVLTLEKTALDTRPLSPGEWVWPAAENSEASLSLLPTRPRSRKGMQSPRAARALQTSLPPPPSPWSQKLGSRARKAATASVVP
jgi:hypothetical protein